jgi:hypothetical protein
VKAFDIIHQDLLYAILERYGLPPSIVKNAAKLCKIKVGREFTQASIRETICPLSFSYSESRPSWILSD